MMRFYDYLIDKQAASGFTTEDALVSFLPLIKQTAECHAAGFVGPFRGLDSLQVDGPRIFFAAAAREEPRFNTDRVSELMTEANRGAAVVVAEHRVEMEDGHESERWEDLRIGDPNEPGTQPLYYPGYLSWEHFVGHHDPVTDALSLGMILASLACSFDFHDRRDLEKFVQHRRNLFAVHPDLHPVLARTIERMTELDRRNRWSDLPSIVQSLENFSEHHVDFQIELDQVEGFHTKDRQTKHQIVLGKLQERLFEVSRRNRLLHFRSTMQTVNLTEASVPLSFDYKNIRPEQLLTWNPKFAKAAISGNPIRLEKYLNFEEAIYLPIVLDRIRNEARRDETEFGFSQLRLVACFLRWTNTKATPPESYHSPLALLPARLVRTKGVRDTYQLTVLSEQAEINPVIRHQFKQLYDIDLPEYIDLAETDLATFHQYLTGKVRASEPAVEIELIDRPRISLLHDKARRRLDQYRRRAKLSGRGVRCFLDVDYSYDPANYHPLGQKLFAGMIRPPRARLSAIVEEHPRPPSYIVEPENAVEDSAKSKTFFQLRSRVDDNPYHWEFDLCAVTLGNFRYRKMSLVRDYTAAADGSIDNASFDAIFSLTPRLAPTTINPPELDDRWHIVPCDPTQTLSIARAQTGGSYIIQGPPGTGKSQTITNLIADFVARGKRVLFVCEKRAAIDVVYLRLKQQRLDELCCLIHDSQTDKKAFVMDLKRTYEQFLERPASAKDNSHALRRLRSDLQPLDAFREAMIRCDDEQDVSLLDIFVRAVELRANSLELTELDIERAPSYSLWEQHRSALDGVRLAIEDIQPDGVFASHPLSCLAPELAEDPQPLHRITRQLDAAQACIRGVTEAFIATAFAPEQLETLGLMQRLAGLCAQWKPLADRRLLYLFQKNSAASRQYADARVDLRRMESRLLETREQNTHWKAKLSYQETNDALRLARQFESQWWRYVSPSWWRLRGVLKRCYDFGSHNLPPPWTDVLIRLMEEHEAEKALERREEDVAESFGVRDGAYHEFFETVDRLRSEAAELPDDLGALAEQLIQDNDVDSVRSLAEAGAWLTKLRDACEGFLADIDDKKWSELQDELEAVAACQEDWNGFLECLAEMRSLPHHLATAIRRIPQNLNGIESAAALRCITERLRGNREVQRFDAGKRELLSGRLETRYADWLGSNALEVKRRVQQRFLNNVKKAESSAATLNSEDKVFKKRYQRGRKTLEHEFGKSMRYKSIRDLVSGDSGEVVKDLKPVWLMSPLSVSDTLPLDQDHFDVVIFDEASQITLEEAVPTIFRAAQAIVVGDEMQLPPTDFFSSKRDEDDVLLLEEDGETVEYDLESNSLLTHAARNLPSTMLGWHYRSRSESLISFSNWSFYHGHLLTIPEEDLPVGERPELLVSTKEDAARYASMLLQRAVSFHFLENGVYENRRNEQEAEYIAHLVREILSVEPHHSIGVVAFSEAQQSEIESALQRLASRDPDFADRYERELEREEEDGQFAGLLVKNLENIQGDERDLIIMSVCYGPDANNNVYMNFGPINRHGGEKRLNVAFSRAKHRMALVSSMRHYDITNDYNDGANCLKRYLRYAERISVGDLEGAQRLLEEIAMSRDAREAATGKQDVVAQQIAQRLEGAGYRVDLKVGQSQFRCDLAAYVPGDPTYRLGILVDTGSYYHQGDTLEREMMKPKLLRDFGWNVERVLAKEWFESAEEVIERIQSRLEAYQPPHAELANVHPIANELPEPDDDVNQTLPDSSAVATLGPDLTTVEEARDPGEDATMDEATETDAETRPPEDGDGTNEGV